MDQVIKKHVFGVCTLLLCMLFCSSCNHGEKKVIEVNETIVSKEPDTHQEVRHIVLRGTNQEIGKAIGDIAQEWLRIKPRIFKNALYGKANRLYLEKNYPILAEQMKGLAQSYNLDPSDYLVSELIYDLWPSACSITSYPPNCTKNGHTMVAHNFDWRPGTFAELFGTHGTSNDHKTVSRNFVMELYPTDGGYSSIGIGSMDFLHGLFDGMNSRGLLVSILVDENCTKNMNLASIDESCGLVSVTLAHLLLDTCANVEEAKTAFLLNKMVFLLEGVHFLVCDTTGKSTICEIDPLLFQWHFTDNNNDPQIMTNHALYLHPDINKFTESKDPYNSFNRYKKLYDFIKSHNEKFSLDNIKESLRLVFGHGIKNEKAIRNRTLWTEVYDLTDKTLEVAFYLKDGPLDPKTGAYDLVFSKPFKFGLKA